jgi:hypothetical protein
MPLQIKHKFGAPSDAQVEVGTLFHLLIVDPTQLIPSFCMVHFVDDLEYSMLDWEDPHLFFFPVIDWWVFVSPPFGCRIVGHFPHQETSELGLCSHETVGSLEKDKSSLSISNTWKTTLAFMHAIF